ncbi:hypothetical protein DUNSADRAFT_4628, partial [Dunaliella salina]
PKRTGLPMPPSALPKTTLLVIPGPPALAGSFPPPAPFPSFPAHPERFSPSGLPTSLPPYAFPRGGICLLHYLPLFLPSMPSLTKSLPSLNPSPEPPPSRTSQGLTPPNLPNILPPYAVFERHPPPALLECLPIPELPKSLYPLALHQSLPPPALPKSLTPLSLSENLLPPALLESLLNPFS